MTSAEMKLLVKGKAPDDAHQHSETKGKGVLHSVHREAEILEA